MNKYPLVSIGIPTYNRPTLLKEAVLSALNQTYKNIEIIISENPSNIDSKIYINNILKNNKNIFYYKQKTNIGSMKNFQFVLDQANGKYFMWLSDDDIIKENFIELCIKEFNNLKEKNIVATTMLTQYFSENELFGFFKEIDCDFIDKEAFVRMKNILNKNYGNLFYSLYQKDALFYNKENILSAFESKNLNEIPYFLAISLKGNWKIIKEIGIYKRTNIKTYLQARWDKINGLIPNHKDIINKKYEIKNYHIETAYFVKKAIDKFEIKQQEKKELKKIANLTIFKHYKKMIHFAQDAAKSDAVFIGMPVYNGEKYISKSIESIINQKFKNWILFISDNNSTDKTFEIAQKYSLLDKRIICLKKFQNQGPINNFIFTLLSCYCNYFKWMACDDILDPLFLQRCIEELKRNDKIMFVFSEIKNIDPYDNPIREYPELPNIIGKTRAETVRNFLYSPEVSGKANIIYSVFRTDFIKQVYNEIKMLDSWGSDMAFVLGALSRGECKIINEVLFYKRICQEDDIIFIKNLKYEDAKKYIFPLDKYEEYLNALMRATQNTPYYTMTRKIMEQRKYNFIKKFAPHLMAYTTPK